jgi:hypothetical protein
MIKLIPVLALLSLAAVAGPPLARRGGDIRPVHAIHAENGLECTDCHTQVPTSTSGMDDLLPGMDTCGQCHDVEDEEKCGMCHLNAEEPAGYTTTPRVAQLFPHEVHVKAGLACSKCHLSGGGPEPAIPEMSLCRTCHATASGFNDCGTCHAAGEERRPASHTPQWLSTHGLEAGMNVEQCETCHTQGDCQDCHAGDNVRPRSHRLNFAFDHALEARADQLRCLTCHEDQQFCTDCHVAEQVLPEDHSRADWYLPGTGGRHAEEARFNMESCIACHDAGSADPLCADCHGR